MAKGISSYTQLFKQMGNNLPLTLKIIAQLVQERWKGLIQTEFYDEYLPMYYERTYAILESLLVTDVKYVGGSYYVKIYIDNDIMNRIHDDTDGYATGEEIVDIIERKGFTLENGVRRNPAQAYDTVVSFLEKEFNSIVKEVMGEMGVKVL